MGLCEQLHDRPFRYGFMIDYEKMHGKYNFSYSEILLLSSRVNVPEIPDC